MYTYLSVQLEHRPERVCAWHCENSSSQARRCHLIVSCLLCCPYRYYGGSCSVSTNNWEERGRRKVQRKTSGVWKGRNEVTMKFPAFLNILMQVFKKFPWHVPCYELLVAVIDAPRLLLQICIFLRWKKRRSERESHVHTVGRQTRVTSGFEFFEVPTKPFEGLLTEITWFCID